MTSGPGFGTSTPITYTRNYGSGTVQHIYVLDNKPTSVVQIDRDGEAHIRGRFSNDEIAAVIEAVLATARQEG